MKIGKAREMTRQFLHVDDVEIEVCTGGNDRHFVRHNVYWWIEYGQKNPDPDSEYIIDSIKNAIDGLPTIRWSGYKFRFETIIFSEENVEAESILLPIKTFEDLMRCKSRFTSKYLEKLQSSEYKTDQNDTSSAKLFA